MQYSDDELLRLVGDERRRSIGFGEGDNGDLARARETALAYHKGEMTDVPAAANRSSVVDTAVADAIETVLPDIMEVFVGGEDVATFVPMGAEDEKRAEEETEFVHHVVFTENEGFLILYSAIKDSLLTRTGLMQWWWEEDEDEETLAESLSEEQAAVMMAEQPGVEMEQGDDGTISLKNRYLHGKVCIKAIPSEDFTIARDAVSLKDATYCALRERTRVQNLIERGLDAEKCRELKPYSAQANEQIRIERDEAGENSYTTSGQGVDDLREVEIRAHYIRLLGDDGKLHLWQVTTDAEETVLLDKEEVEQIQIAALTPYIVPHRFHGESVADKMIEVQKIKTILLRNHLDSIYFALNQRNEVDMSGVNEFTISDLLRNEPGMPIRVQRSGTITAVAAGALNVDILGSLEYAETVGEKRSGIVRNAQGLNPDTLHDTAKGALALIAAAQKRVRMIARIFAETGVKDLFLGVHALLRRGYTDRHKPGVFKRGKDWSEVRPNEWPERGAMTIHVGVGSAGREQDMLIAEQRLQKMAEVLSLQGGAQGPFVDPQNVFNALNAWERGAGSKSPELYWSDPAQAPPQPPKPDPQMEKVKAELALKTEQAKADVMLTREKGAADVETERAKHQAQAQSDALKAQNDYALAVAKLQAEMELKKYQVDAELALKREQLSAELELKRELGFAQAAVAHETGMAKVAASTSEVEPGGEPG